ncbi:50S ribosomal protein L9 [Caldithrix abyssi DSM 13497]|uniref:Large ribosomal subunit protein bL9 n=1 Tax=Caldithrix abyssi DSM 13497 TaxID=880073 RepID=H1XY91_CALAY|nr:50S ribosomal protein L9 [Caldithrix abyssi]APF17967.1 rplI LSU ribosomal protein L9P [Caldithrix abyssi DSM 13497]EHO42018.1 50S ribosomal protein L9 [Caldithrix abyssi DSM 13497]
MEIILRQDYQNLGKTGDVVKVKDGYARNYLIPKGIAYIATKENKKRLENELKVKSLRVEKEKLAADELAKKLANVSCTIPVQVGEEDKLFGSVTSQNIADALAAQGIKVDRRKIQLEEPIKSLGIYSVPIKLHPEVEATVKVWVVKE